MTALSMVLSSLAAASKALLKAVEFAGDLVSRVASSRDLAFLTVVVFVVALMSARSAFERSMIVVLLILAFADGIESKYP